MTLQDWLRNAIEDANRRGLPALAPLLETLAKSTASLREADSPTSDAMASTFRWTKREPAE